MLEPREFEDRKAANVRAVKLMVESQSLKVIEVVDGLLEGNPSLPVFVQDGDRRLPVVSVRADPEHGVGLQV